MRKILKTVLVLCILSVNAYGQNDVQKDSLLILKAFNKNDLVETKSEIVDSLENVVLRLSNKVGKIEENNLKSKKNDYESKSKLIKAQLNLLKELRETTETIISDRELMKTNTYISQINNPTANTLGFSFTEVVSENLESVLTEYLNNPLDDNPAIAKFRAKKTSFLTRIKSIVSVIAPIFPPLEIVNRITNKLENHVESITSWTGNSSSSNAKNLIIENETVFKPVIIRNFTEKLKLYITFYKRLSETNDTFLSDIETNRIKYNPSLLRVNEIISSIKNKSNIDFDNTTSLDDQVDILFEDNGTNKKASFYNKIVEKRGVKEILLKLRSTLSLVDELNEFHSDYQIIVLKNYDNYINSLDGALILPKSNKVKIQKIKDVIKETRDGVKDDVTKIGFVNKYSKQLRKVNNYLEQIQKELYKY
jgi:hypothetical protein